MRSKFQSDQLNNRDSGHRLRGGRVARFCLLFLFLILGFTTLTSTAFAELALHEPLIRLVVTLSVPILSILGDASASGTDLTFNGFEGTIVEACDGVLPAYIYIAAILAFPSRWRYKGWGILFGVGIILLFNLMRVVTLMVFGSFYPDLVEWVHIYVWQVLIITLSMAVWVFWLERYVLPRTATSP